MFGAVISVSENDVEKAVDSYFRSGKTPDTHESWKSGFATAWYVEPDERFSPVAKRRSAVLVMPASEAPAEMEKALQGTIVNLISLSKGPIRDHVEWSITYEDGAPIFVDGELGLSRSRDEWTLFGMGEMISKIYEGMRYLPYTDEQVARAITRYVVMARFGCYEVIEQTEGVEFSGGQIWGRGFCRKTSLLKAIREDFYELIKPEKLDDEGKMDFRDTVLRPASLNPPMFLRNLSSCLLMILFLPRQQLPLKVSR